jgi:hypothetical protein
MAETRYRISDKGILLYFNDTSRRWEPINCSDIERYCGIDCHFFKVSTPKDNNVTLKCVESHVILEIEG